MTQETIINNIDTLNKNIDKYSKKEEIIKKAVEDEKRNFKRLIGYSTSVIIAGLTIPFFLTNQIDLVQYVGIAGTVVALPLALEVFNLKSDLKISKEKIESIEYDLNNLQNQLKEEKNKLVQMKEEKTNFEAQKISEVYKELLPNLSEEELNNIKENTLNILNTDIDFEEENERKLTLHM